MLYTHIHLTPPLTVDTTSNTLRLKNGPQTASLLALIKSGFVSAQFSFPFTFQLFVKKNPQPSQPVVVSNLLFHIENLVLPLQILLNAQTWMTFNQKKKFSIFEPNNNRCLPVRPPPRGFRQRY